MNGYDSYGIEIIPYGLTAAFARSPMAYKNFSELSEKEQAQIISRAQAAQHPCEIKSIIRALETTR